MSLNVRLILMVVALLAVTIGGIAVISTRVVHREIRKLEVDVRVPARAAPATPATLTAFAREHHADGVLFDAQRHLVAATFHPSRMELSADGTLTIVDGMAKKMLRGGLRTADGGYLFLLPKDDLPTPRRALDRAFVWIFSVAALAGIAMAVAIARWIANPIERLTAATRRMERGDLTVRVAPGGGPELGALAHGFNAMAAALDRNEALRRRMVTDVAHELRAPLTNIRCELESMQDGLTAATPERIASLHEETMHLARLVDDLQTLSLAEAGALEIAPQPVAVASLVRRASASVAADGPPDLVVMADPTRTVQILTNLLTNAMHVSDDVRVSWRRDGNEARIDVIDRGPGIAADQLPHLFERFYRVDPSRSRHTGGAGLGLAIVKQLVQAQGGRVWAESAVGVGSTFSFTMPVAEGS
ncbi:MAG TPA: ATP-binding protein [Thermoanaerobaculia bacterium]